MYLSNNDVCECCRNNPLSFPEDDAGLSGMGIHVMVSRHADGVLENGKSEFIHSQLPVVTIVTGLGGAGLVNYFFY